jgi:predicted N-formylglutamate amidohydrolase
MASPSFVFACDHASAALPAEANGLGLPPAAFTRHIALDLGAADLACALGERFAAPVVLAPFSRLYIDCNRRLDDSTSIPEASDGTVIPGNQQLVPEARAERARLAFHPYHAAVAAACAQVAKPVLVAVHSFTPALSCATSRPWNVGVLWDRDAAFALPLLGALRGAGLCVGDNLPYSLRHPARYTLERHGEAWGRHHVGLEVRQDLLTATGGVTHWARMVGDALATAGATL